MFRELRATAPQTYHTFWTSNGAADVLYVLLKSLTAQGLQACFCLGFESKGAWPMSALAKSTRILQILKIAADVRQSLRGPTVSPQTCDKSKIGLLEVNFCESKKCLKKLGFHSVFSVLCVFEKKDDQEEDDVAQEDFLRADIIYYKYYYNQAFFVIGLPLFQRLRFPWGCSSLPRVTPPL